MGTQPTFITPIQITVRSVIPGRVRWDIPSLLDQADVCAFLDSTLMRQGGVQSVFANAITGRVLLTYDRSLPLQSFQTILEQVLYEAFMGGLEGHSPDRPRENQLQSLRHDPNASSLTRLLELTRKHKTRAILALIVAFVDRLFEAAPPAMIGVALDVVTRRSGSFLGRLGFKTITSQLFALGGLSLVVWTIDACMGYLHSITSARLALEVQNDLRNQIYRHLQTLDVGQIEQKPVSAWLRLLDSDVGRIGQFIDTGIDPLVSMVTNGLIVTITILLHSPALFAAQLAILPGLYLVSTNLLGPIRKRQEIAQQQSEQLSTALHNNLSGMATIAVFGTQAREAERIAALGLQAQEATQKRVELSATYVPAIQMVVGVGFLTTLLWGGILVDRGTLSIASYNVMGFSSLRLLVALGSLGVSLDQYQRTSISIERVLDFMDRQPTITDGDRVLPVSRTADILFENVSFQYEAGQPVLHKLNLRFIAGRTTGIVGATGAGKTTILKLILRFYDVGSGAIRLDGIDIRELKLDALRKGISIVPQRIFLFNGTIRDNISYSRPDAPMDEIIRAARAAQAHQFIEALPEGYETRLNENGIKLSGGQQQRIAIARAILADYQILLFDEATSAIDYETEAAIQNALRDFTKDRTTVIVAHRLSTVRHADVIYVLDEGRVVEEGQHEDLIRIRGIYANLWRIQTGEPPTEAKPSNQRPTKPPQSGRRK